MRIDNATQLELNQYFSKIDNYVKEKEQKFVRFADFGCKILRIISYSDKFLPHIEKQLTYVLRENSDRYDATIYLWEEQNALKLFQSISEKFNPAKNFKLRIELLYSKQKEFDIQIINKDFSVQKPAINYNNFYKIISAYNKKENSYYYGVKDLSAEEFIKEGHLFIQFINEVIKSDSSNLSHGASMGLNGNGILFCARGQRGKSTLSVLSMMRGFEYVSDDYLTIYNDNKGNLYTSPIYSIITLSPEMYGRLYDDMKGTQFVSNNARKDKYVFNISNFHSQFRTDYPIKLAIFPEIVTDKDPSIRLCTPEEKGRAITHLIQSTLSQVSDLCEEHTIKKMYNMVKDLPFYKFNLCHDIERNTVFLRDFMNNWDKQDKTIISAPPVFIDITFNLANIIDIQSGTVYTMNTFATNVFENLLNGVRFEDLRKELSLYKEYNENIEYEFDLLIKFIQDKNIQLSENKNSNINLNKEFINTDNFKLYITEFSHELGPINILEKKENKENDKLQVK